MNDALIKGDKMNKKCIKDIDIKDKKLLIRVDFNVPLDENVNITDDNRIRAALPTIEYALEKEAKIILMSHLGRPKGEVKERLRLTPVAKRLEELLNKSVKKTDDCIGPEVVDITDKMSSGDIVLLENLRFHNDETKNNPEFAKKLAQLGDIFVNDAFGTCHRAHASTEGVTHYLESVSGFLVEKEIEYFEKINSSPEKPFVLILGGAKVSDKIPLIENMLSRVDSIIIGGAMAYTFLKVKGVEIGAGFGAAGFFFRFGRIDFFSFSVSGTGPAGGGLVADKGVSAPVRRSCRTCSTSAFERESRRVKRISRPSRPFA